MNAEHDGFRTPSSRLAVPRHDSARSQTAAFAPTYNPQDSKEIPLGDRILTLDIGYIYGGIRLHGVQEKTKVPKVTAGLCAPHDTLSVSSTCNPDEHPPKCRPTSLRKPQRTRNTSAQSGKCQGRGTYAHTDMNYDNIIDAFPFADNKCITSTYGNSMPPLSPVLLQLWTAASSTTPGTIGFQICACASAGSRIRCAGNIDCALRRRHDLCPLGWFPRTGGGIDGPERGTLSLTPEK